MPIGDPSIAPLGLLRLDEQDVFRIEILEERADSIASPRLRSRRGEIVREEKEVIEAVLKAAPPSRRVIERGTFQAKDLRGSARVDSQIEVDFALAGLFERIQEPLRARAQS